MGDTPPSFDLSAPPAMLLEGLFSWAKRAIAEKNRDLLKSIEKVCYSEEVGLILPGQMRPTPDCFAPKAAPSKMGGGLWCCIPGDMGLKSREQIEVEMRRSLPDPTDHPKDYVVVSTPSYFDSAIPATAFARFEKEYLEGGSIAWALKSLYVSK